MPYADPQSEAAMESRRRATQKYYKANREREIQRSALYNAEHREQVNARSVARRQRRPVHEVLWWNARNRAKSQGIEFDLAYDDIVVPTHCPVLGIALVVGTGAAGPGSPSLDRINPDRGYVRGNISVISHKANTIKSNAAVADLRAVLAYMEKHLG